MFIIKHRGIFLSISLVLVVASLVAMYSFGFNLGTDFTGGSILEVAYTSTGTSTIPQANEVRSALATTNLGSATVQPVGANGYLVKMKTVTEDEKVTIRTALSLGNKYQFTEKRFDSIGPAIGQELARKGIIAIVIVALLVILFIALAFRGVSRPISSWKYGLIAVIALLHDVIISTGFFVVLGRYQGAEMDALFLTAILTILALSVNDTIVIFDRIRENLKNKISLDFEETVGLSLNQTFTRSLITAMTIVLVMLCLFFFGGSSTKNFALVLSFGMFIGTYSSLFVASPLLVLWNKSLKKA